MMQLYLAVDGNAVHWDLIRAGMMSVANTFVVPAQDLMGLDTEHRMNLPGRPEGNWSWRLRDGMLDGALAKRVRDMTLLYERCANPPEKLEPAKAKEPPY